ncbi:MAG: FHA domain-containing protein [Lentisphaeria bacterium]|jgi:class 3 adenylate cyclase
MPHLIIRKCPVAIPERIALPPGTVVFGRGKADIKIPDPGISARHFALATSGYKVELTDLGSRNGTFLDGARVAGGGHLLKHGQIIRAGDTEMSVFLVEPQQLSTAAPGTGAAGGGAAPFAIRPDPAADAALASLLEFKLTPVPEPLPPVQDAATARQLVSHFRCLERGLRELHAALTPPELLQHAMGLMLEILHCASGFMVTLNPHDPTIAAEAVAYLHGRRNDEFAAHPRNQSLIRKVLDGRAGILGEIRPPAAAGAAAGGEGLRHTVIGCPLHAAGQLVGVVGLEGKRSGSTLDKCDLELAMALASLVGIALENLRTVQQISQQTRIADNLGRFVSDQTIDAILRERKNGYPHLQPRKAHVVVLQSEIRGFTRLCGGLPPADVAAMLNLYHAATTEVALGLGGTLHTVANDRIVLLFNAPVELLDPEAAAVQAARELRRRLQELQPQWERHGLPRFELGLGIAAGECIVGSVGSGRRLEFAAIGECVDLANHLCRRAKPGQALLPATIHDRLRRPAQCRETVLATPPATTGAAGSGEEPFRCRPAGSTDFHGGAVKLFELLD